MRAALPLAVALCLFPCGVATAQEASLRETRCWVGDVTFSAGAGINTGSGTAVCTAGSGWEAAEGDALVAGCLLEGKLSSVGAVVGIRNTDRMLLQCDASGRWMSIEATSGG